MKSDLNGCSTCQIGQEVYTPFIAKGRQYIQYDFRNSQGKLFSCVAGSLSHARQKRDKWMDGIS